MEKPRATISPERTSMITPPARRCSRQPSCTSVVETAVTYRGLPFSIARPFRWQREHRRAGGVIIDVRSGEIVARGFSMPHSPRVHRGTLYVVNSGAGEFGRVDVSTGRFEPIAFCPGYARGLAFIGDYAVIGLSGCRENRTFQGLPLDEVLEQKNVQPRCGLQVVDLRTGDTVHSLMIEGVVRELYDVAVLPGVVRPAALGFKTDEIRRTISIEE